MNHSACLPHPLWLILASCDSGEESQM